MDQILSRREITLEELKGIQLELLDSVHNFCEKYGLTYYLAYGTLIGAVRHKGFIPWDDDIDIIMPRNDYQRFIELAKKNPIASNISFSSIQNDDKCIYPFLKVFRKDTEVRENISVNYVLGVGMDIFPLDNMSNDLNKAQKLFNDVKKLRKIKEAEFWVSNSMLPLWKRWILICYGKVLKIFFPFNRLNISIDRKARRYESETMSKYVCVVVLGTYGLSEIMESSAFSKRETMWFEGRERFVPKGWDYILTRMYGDYMQLPPEEKRKSHHSFSAYWK